MKLKYIKVVSLMGICICTRTCHVKGAWSFAVDRRRAKIKLLCGAYLFSGAAGYLINN